MENEENESVFVDALVDFFVDYYDAFRRFPSQDVVQQYFIAELEKNIEYILDEAEVEINLFSCGLYDIEE